MKKQPTAPSVAEHYHRQTIYSPETMSSFVADADGRPPLFREVVTDLSFELDRSTESEGRRGDLHGRLSRLLAHTAGVTLIHETGEGPFYFRAAPSAGALYPTEVYVITRDLEEFPDGIHLYAPLEHRLVPLWEGDFGLDVEELCFRHTSAIRAKIYLVFSAVFQRSFWRYRDRAYRRILLDTGHMLANAVAYGPRQGFQLVAITGFYDAAINDLMFFDSRKEATLAVAPVLDLQDISDSRINSPFPYPSRKSIHEYASAGDEGVMRLLHRRSEIVPEENLISRVPSKPLTLTRTRPSPRGEAIFLVPDPDAPLPRRHLNDLGTLIRERRSTRNFADGPITRQALFQTLGYAYEPVARYWRASGGLSLSSCVLSDPTLLTTYIVALNVDGLRSGIYLFDPETCSVHLERAGDFRSELHSICLHQALGRDASAAIIHTANLPAAVRRYGDRGYRYIHLDAGHIGERINLAALGSGIGVSGIGGFFDDDVNQLLGLPSLSDPLKGNEITAYITLLGVPKPVAS